MFDPKYAIREINKCPQGNGPPLFLTQKSDTIINISGMAQSLWITYKLIKD